MTRKKRVFIETYGCQMNVADTELILGELLAQGYEKAAHLGEADIILLNTCAIREKAEERIYGRSSQLLRFKYSNPDLILGITGCMAEHLKERLLKRAPYIDLIVGPDSYRRLGEQLSRAGFGDPIIDVRLDKGETYEGMTPARSQENGLTGWVSIQRGCDKFCSFCIVPYVRGRERAASLPEVLRQVRDLVQIGYKEVTLLGQTVNSYLWESENGTVDFADLLKEVAKIDGIERIRYASPYPTDFSQKLIDTLAEEKKICNYLHLPIQSGADSMLSRMKRGYTLDDFRSIVAQLRSQIPNIAISTDIIVGFPDETEEEYQATLAMMREFRFDSAFMFAYSEREGTFASKRIPDTISAKLKQSRLARLIRLQEEIGGEVYANKVGKTVFVLAEGPSKRSAEKWFGKSEGFKTTIFTPKKGIKRGDIVPVTIQRTTSHTLFG